MNFEKKIVEIEKLFDVWRRFNLSLVGKLTVIKTLALPKIIYLLSVLRTPSDTEKESARNSYKRIYQMEDLNLINLRSFNKALNGLDKEVCLK